MATTYGTVFGNSNMRTTSRQTRTNPTRTSKTNGSNLRQNSLVSNQPPSVQGFSEPHGFYPAIQHFTDAISALPRDYRRHTSLLKEVDAKAWQPEENLQTLVVASFADRPDAVLPTMPMSANGSTTNVAEDAQVSAANSTVDLPADALSQFSNPTASSAAPTRRQLFGALRHNLVQIMVTMDEKNHVINNANEELTRHLRRLGTVWPHLADEISEESRLGSLKHWAFTDINPTKKPTVPSTRREAAANLALLHDNEVAQRSESRREAVAAKTKQRLDRVAALEGVDEAKTSKKKTAPKETQRRDVDSASELPGLGITTKGKKGAKALGGAAMEKSLSAVIGGRAMSREPSQQEASKKRKAPASGAAVARKRVNAAQDSPKLVSSPLASTFGKEAYKRSPALSAARPVSARARQNSTQVEGSKPKSSANQRNNGATSAAEIKSVAAATGKTVTEVKHKQSTKESTNARGDRTLDGESTSNGDATTRGGLIERRASKSRLADANDESSTANSPRPSVAALNLDRTTSRGGRAGNKASSTPTLGTFADSGQESSNGNGKDGASKNAKRPARQRVKYDGLHDSLSPKGLPPKRLHKKNGSFVGLQQTTSGSTSTASRSKEDVTSAAAAAGESLMSATASATPTPVDERLGGLRRTESAAEEVDQMDVDQEERQSVGVERGRASTRAGGSRGPTEKRGQVQVEREDEVEEVEEYVEDEVEVEVEVEDDDEDAADDGEGDGDDEEKYCYCQTGSYGEMVACDNDMCPREWFHLECIGLKSVPKSAKWYCNECKAAGCGTPGGADGLRPGAPVSRVVNGKAVYADGRQR